MVRTSARLSRAGFTALWLSLAAQGCSAPAAPAASPTADPAARAAAARELFERGERLAREGDSVRAEQYLAAALREGHAPEQVLPVLMRVCLTGSRLRAALNHASPYLKQHPDAVWLRYLVANVHLGLRQPMQAREHLLMIEAQDPGHARAQYLLGLTEWESFGDQSAAARHFESYLRLEPKGQHAAEVQDWLRARAVQASLQRAAEAQPAAVVAAPVKSPVPAPDEAAVVSPNAVPPPSEGVPPPASDTRKPAP